jgi:hypothetical protein
MTDIKADLVGVLPHHAALPSSGSPWNDAFSSSARLSMESSPPNTLLIEHVVQNNDVLWDQMAPTMCSLCVIEDHRETKSPPQKLGYRLRNLWLSRKDELCRLEECR